MTTNDTDLCPPWITKDDDSGAIQRIKMSAIKLFGERGFSVTIKNIATAAQVSPGLVIHHFGSKDKLRKSCDDYAAQVLKEIMESSPTQDGIDILRHALLRNDQSIVVAYILSSLEAGGELAKNFINNLIQSTEEFLSTGEKAGTVRKTAYSNDRAAWLCYVALGGLLLYRRLHYDRSVREIIEEYVERFEGVRMEIFTQSLFIPVEKP